MWKNLHISRARILKFDTDYEDPRPPKEVVEGSFESLGSRLIFKPAP
jgi:hypothetical protein